MEKQEVIDGLFDLYKSDSLTYDDRETVKEAIQLLLKEKPAPAPTIPWNFNPYGTQIKTTGIPAGPYTARFDADSTTSVNNSDHVAFVRGGKPEPPQTSSLRTSI
jgi:hypothetical protein